MNETKIIKNITDDFFERREKYKILYQENTHLFFENIDAIFNKIELPRNYYLNLSSYFFPFMETIINITGCILPIRVKMLFKNIINKLMIDMLNINNQDLMCDIDEESLRESIKSVSNHSLNFINFINEFDEIDEESKSIFVKEFLLGTMCCFIMRLVSKDINYKLWFYVQSLWIIFDNIIDIPSLKRNKGLIKETIVFLKEKIYNRSLKEIMEYIKYSKEPCLKILKKIILMDNLSKEAKENILKKLGDLYEYSYSIKGLKNEKEAIDKRKIIEITILKCKKSLDIFDYAIIRDKDESRDYKLAFIIQLLDDFTDLRADMENRNNTIFTNKNETLLDRAVNVIILLEYVNKEFPVLLNIFSLAIIGYTDYNKEYLPEVIVKKMKSYVWINYESCNIEKCYDLISNLQFISKLTKIYLNNDLLSNDYNKLTDNEIIAEMNLINMENKY